MKRKRIALHFSGVLTLYREIVEGMAAYLQHHPEWEIIWQGQNLFWLGPEVWSCGADAVICGPLRKEEVSEIRRFKGKVICVSNFRREERVLAVVNDDREVGRTAGRHLSGLGFRQLAFVNSSNSYFAEERLAGAREILEERPGSRLQSFSVPDLLKLAPVLDEILKVFDPPFAIYCDTDMAAVKLAETAFHRGFRIPEDAALLGTDNSPLLCQFCRPRLSSVALDARRIGMRIGALLEELPEKGGVPPRRIEIPPLGVEARRSTDITALEDRRVARALEILRARKGRDLTVEQLAREAGMSRRLLEVKFKETLHRTPYQEMLRLRVEHARDLLRRTDWTIGRVAEETGFQDIRTFNRTFLSEVGLPPREFRKGPS